MVPDRATCACRSAKIRSCLRIPAAPSTPISRAIRVSSEMRFSLSSFKFIFVPASDASMVPRCPRPSRSPRSARSSPPESSRSRSLFRSSGGGAASASGGVSGVSDPESSRPLSEPLAFLGVSSVARFRLGERRGESVPSPVISVSSDFLLRLPPSICAICATLFMLTRARFALRTHWKAFNWKADWKAGGVGWTSSPFEHLLARAPY
jgi:hypothetical protein